MLMLFSFITFMIIAFASSLQAKVITREATSSISVANGAYLITNNQITNISGNLQLETGSTVAGQGIDFTVGSITQNNRQIALTGLLSGQSEIMLTGNQEFTGNGKALEQLLLVSGSNNRIDGEVVLSYPLQLLDSFSSVTLALTRRLNNDILLNGGSLFLEEDLEFIDQMLVEGPGTISLNGRRLVFGARDLLFDTKLFFDGGQDIVLRSDVYVSVALTFSGANKITGNGHNIILDDGGSIAIGRGSSLLLHHVAVKNVHDSNLFCLDNVATLTLQLAQLLLSDNFTFSLGGIRYQRDCSIGGGNHTFAYQSVMPSVVASNASLTLESGLTFSYDPMSASQNLLQFEDSQSLLFADGVTFYISPTGMQLTNGQAFFDNTSYIIAPLSVDPLTQQVLSGGLILGNGTEGDDFSITLNSGALLDFVQGQLVYNNVDSASWTMVNEICTLRMEANTSLMLEQTLNIGPGRLNLSNAAYIAQSPGANFVGSVNIIS